MHTSAINDIYSAFIDNFSSTEVPRKISIVGTIDGKKSKLLLTADNPLKEFTNR